MQRGEPQRLDRLAMKLDCSLRKRLKFAAEVGDAGGVTLVKPQTFMNRSGAAVAGLVNWLKLVP
jgi:peptidyl-tRNA hydrolase